MTSPDALQKTRLEELQPYSISVTKFEIAPKELKPYEPGHKITRENFINFLIKSFSISRGQQEVQILFMVWLKIRTGFDYSATLDNFIQAGGWNVLSDEEKSEFEKQFDKIVKHFEAENLRAQIEEELKQTELRAREVATSSEENIEMSTLKNMGTFHEFSDYAQNMIKLLRNRPKKNV